MTTIQDPSNQDNRSNAMALKITFTGDAVANHDIDLVEFSNSMLGLAATIKASGKLLVGKDYNVKVNLSSSIEPNCVTIILNLTTGEILGGAVLLLSTVDIRQILANIGFIGSNAYSLIQFIKRIFKQTVQTCEGKGKDIKITFADGSYIIIPMEIFEMSKDSNIRKNMFKFVRILSRQGYENIKIEDVENPNSTRNVINKKDVAAFIYKVDEELQEREFEVIGEIDRPSLRGERRNWIVVTPDGENSYHATMKDNDFMDAIDQGLCEFRNGNTYKVTLHAKQVKEGAKTKIKYDIIKIVQLSANQSTLF